MGERVGLCVGAGVGLSVGARVGFAVNCSGITAGQCLPWHVNPNYMCNDWDGI